LGFKLCQTIRGQRKSTKWAHEKEWRFIMHRGRESTVGDPPIPRAALRKVILGPRLTEAEREEVRTWVRSGPFARNLFREIAMTQDDDPPEG
jgi:hypothetical protein